MDEIVSSLAAAKLVPGPLSPIVPANFRPTTRVEVSFASGRAVRFGDLFRAGECKEAPAVSLSFEGDDGATEDEEGEGYMIMLVDPDAPTPEDPKFSFWRHWVLERRTRGGDRTLTEYLGPGPKDDSTPHRYLFLVFRQPRGLSLSRDDVGGEEFVQRRSFALGEFVRRNGLVLVGLNMMMGAGDGWQS